MGLRHKWRPVDGAELLQRRKRFARLALRGWRLGTALEREESHERRGLVDKPCVARDGVAARMR